MAKTQDSVDILSQCLDSPVLDDPIMVGDFPVVVYPAGLPETRDLAKKFREMGVEEGDDVDVGSIDFIGHVFWLVIRQGTPAMTPRRVRREQWEVPKEAATSMMGLYAKTEGQEPIPVIELARLTGLFGEEDDDEGEAEGGETPPSPQPNEKGEESGEAQ